MKKIIIILAFSVLAFLFFMLGVEKGYRLEEKKIIDWNKEHYGLVDKL